MSKRCGTGLLGEIDKTGQYDLRTEAQWEKWRRARTLIHPRKP